MGIRFTAIVGIAILLQGCAQGHCRRMAETPGLKPTPVATPAPTSPQSERVLVYKYDGSLQCGAGKVVTPETMAKELGGIPIFSSQKKSDGLMHIQVCGSITGKANVFEIPSRSLKQAEAKGFKIWSFE